MERRGKSSPECGKPHCHVNPIRRNIDREAIVGPALPTDGWSLLATKDQDRLSQKQNSAYRFSHKGRLTHELRKGVLFSALKSNQPLLTHRKVRSTIAENLSLFQKPKDYCKKIMNKSLYSKKRFVIIKRKGGGGFGAKYDRFWARLSDDRSTASSCRGSFGQLPLSGKFSTLATKLLLPGISHQRAGERKGASR